MRSSFLSTGDTAELKASGLSESWILESGAETISLESALERGFRAEVLNEELVEECLYLPFFDKFGNKIIDEKTQKQIGVIKPRYKDQKEKRPKYLCLPKSAQSRMYIHHPKGFDWKKFYANKSEQKIYLTEGWKKAESACSMGIPTICIWSVFCFNEAGMNTALIPELKEILICQK